MGYDRASDSALKNTQNSFGTFSTPTFYGVGEPYVDGYSCARLGPPTAASPRLASPGMQAGRK